MGIAAIAIWILIFLVRRLRSSSEPGKPALTFSRAPIAIVRIVSAAVGTTALAMGSPTALFVASASFAMALPGLTCRSLLIPVGVPHLAYWFTRITYLRQGRSEAAFYELQARLRRGAALPCAGLRARVSALFVATHDRFIHGAALGARAIQAALDGDLTSARQLFSVGQSLHFWNGRADSAHYCQAVLLADAAQRGAYHEVARLAVRGPHSRRRWFLRGAALRMLGAANAPRPFTLTVLWALAPARRAGWPLLRSALAQRPRASIAVDGPGFDAAQRATLLVRRLPPGAVTRAELRSIAHAWQVVFDSGEVRARLQLRAQQLGAGFDAAAATSRFETEITQLLARLLGDAPPESVQRDDDPALLLAAKDQLQSELLDELEALCAAMPRGAVVLPCAYESYWLAWATVYSLSLRFFDALPERTDRVIDGIGVPLMNHGAWLYNQKDAKLLAYEIFRWLCELAPQDWPDRKLLKKNRELALADLR